nr:hypothetical protein [Tanacetum cinerariifolium]
MQCIATSFLSRNKLMTLNINSTYGISYVSVPQNKSHIKEVVKSGQLSHHVKGIKKERAKTFDSQQGEKKEKSTTPAEAPILMINQEEACSRNNISKSPTFKGREITFPQLRRAHREGCRASRGDSHTRNHPEYGFMLLETIRRLLVVIGSRLIRASKGRPSNRRGCSFLLEIFFAKELNEFLSSYPIPSEYDVILPTSTQTIFEAPTGYVGLYTHSFSLANLRLPLTDFFLDKFQKRSKKHIPNLFPKVITPIEGWHERFFFVQDSIISSKYPQLLLEENMLNLKSFKDKLPLNIDENPYFQRLGRYPTTVHVFDDPILFLAGLKPSYAEEPKVLPAEITTDSRESLKASMFIMHPGSVVGRIKERMCKTKGGSLRPLVKRKLALGSSSSRVVKENSRKGQNQIKTGQKQEAWQSREKFKVVTVDRARKPEENKKRMAKNANTSQKLFKFKEKKKRQGPYLQIQESKKKGAFSVTVSKLYHQGRPMQLTISAPILSISNDDEGKFLVRLVLSKCIDLLIHPLSSLYVLFGLPDCFELKDANACHLKISAITPPAWKVNKKAREFLQVIVKISDEADVIKAMKRSHEEECEKLLVKCEAAIAEFDQNSTASYQVTLLTLELKVDSLEAEKVKLEAVEVSLHREVEELKQDRRDVVLKVVPYAAIELVHSNELGRLVGTLVSSAITYGCCRAYEQVAAMKEPVNLSKAKGYRSSYKKEHTQTNNDFATATFPWLDEFVADAAASIEALLSKKPPTDAISSFSVCRVVIPSGSSEGSCVALSYGQIYCATFIRSEGSCVALSYGQMYCATFTRRYSWMGSIQLFLSCISTFKTSFSSIDLLVKTSTSTSFVRCLKVIDASLLSASAFLFWCLLSGLPEVGSPGILPLFQFPFPKLSADLLTMLRILLHCLLFRTQSVKHKYTLYLRDLSTLACS